MEGIKRELEHMADTVNQPVEGVKENNNARERVASAIKRVKLDQNINNTELADAIGCSSSLITLLIKRKRPCSRLVLSSFTAKYNLSQYYFTGESEELYSGGFKGWKTELIIEVGKMFQDDHRETIQNVLYYIKSMNEARAAKRQP